MESDLFGSAAKRPKRIEIVALRSAWLIPGGESPVSPTVYTKKMAITNN